MKIEISERTIYLAIEAIQAQLWSMEERYESADEIPKNLHYKARVRAYDELVKALEKGDLIMLPTDKWIKD